MGKLYLNGKWNLKDGNNKLNLEVDVPKSNFTQLIENKVIEDPFYGTNEKNMAWIGETDWIYNRTFNVDKEILDKKFIMLNMDMLDTICNVYLNGELILNAKNCHIKYSIDIKKYLKVGENKIELFFESPVNYVKKHQKEEMVPRNNNGQNGIPHIRKPQSHFGWDWGPQLVPSGIIKDIYITYSNVPCFKNFEVVQEHVNGTVILHVNASVEGKENYKLKLNIEDPNGQNIYENEVFSSEIKEDITIDNPILWWTYELNQVEKQPLYKVTINVRKDEDQVELIKHVGLRTIKLNQEEDEFGTNFCFELNGVKIFAKGANLIPEDSFIDRVDNKKIDFYLDTARFSNFNMIRVWGGGFYGSDYFYDKCDEMGILVWQDFMFACQPYPFFMEEFTKNVLEEIEFNVRRIKDHPSIALWCGNNEIEVMDAQWFFRPKYLKWTEKFFYHILPEKLAEIDSITPYIPGTPIGTGYRKKVASDDFGDTHLWAVWHGLQPLNYYTKRNTRFCSEYGFESLPDLKAIEKYSESKDYSLDSEVFKSHQKCLSGNNKMKYYIAERFRLPKYFIDYIYLSQICQLECSRQATENWRRYKGRCNGSLYWQFNDCWPVCSWSSVDYYGNYKALQYGARHFNSPFTISIKKKSDRARVYVHNDTLESKKAHLNMQFITFDGVVKFEKDRDVELEPNSVIRKKILMFDDLQSFDIDNWGCVLVVKMTVDGKEVARRTELFGPEKKTNLPKANISMDVKKVGNMAEITLCSDKYARFVQLYSKSNSKHFSDNFFDLLPNEPITITQEIDENVDEEVLKYDYSVKSLTDIEPMGSFAHDNFERFKVFMEPANFFQYLYYMFL